MAQFGFVPHQVLPCYSTSRYVVESTKIQGEIKPEILFDVWPTSEWALCGVIRQNYVKLPRDILKTVHVGAMPLRRCERSLKYDATRSE